MNILSQLRLRPLALSIRERYILSHLSAPLGARSYLHLHIPLLISTLSPHAGYIYGEAGIYYYRPPNWKLGLMKEEIKSPFDPNARVMK